jgi:hypothetical protein
MGIAFSASMFGLVTSLMLAIMMISLRRYVSRVVACARNVMHDLTELGQAASGSAGAVVSQLTPEQIEAMAVGGGSAAGFTGGGRVARVSPATLSDGDSSLQDLVYQVNDTSLLVANHIDSLTHKIDALIHVFESSVKLSQKQNELLATVPRLSDTSDKILKEMRDLVGGQAEQQKFFQLLVDASSETLRSQNGLLGAVPALNDTGGKILKELKGLTSGQGEQQRLSQMLVDASGHMTHAQNDLLRAVPGLSETGESILSELKGLFGGSAEQQKLLQALEAAGNNSTQIVSGITGVQREVQVKLNASLANLDDRLARIEETATNFAGHMEDIKENSTHFKAYSGVAETIADGIGHQTLLLETLVKEDRNLQKRLVSIQQDLREQLLRLDPEAPEDAPPST